MYFDGSLFEFIMLICFGISWPVTILKTLRSKTVKGVSPLFYFLILTGYLSGSIYKLVFNFNYVVYVYLFNLLTVSSQIILYYYFYNKEKNAA